MPNITPVAPSHTLFYWKPWREDANLIESWMEWLKDVKKAEYSASLVGQYINEASKEQVEAIGRLGETLGISIEHSSDKIVDFLTTINATIQKGIDCILNGLGNIETELSILNGNLELVLEQQRITNLLLENIFEVLRLPEREKERNYRIELGLKFFSNASKDPDLFEDSLNEFLEAEKLMKQDYFVLHRIGMIYLYSEKHINVEKALDYFTKAAKYASVESDPKAARIANILRKNNKNKSGEIENDTEAIGFLASDSYEKAAFASYILGDFQSAIKMQKKAIVYEKNASKYFMLSKYQSRNKLISDCISSLETCLILQTDYIFAVLKDFDLNSESDILKFIETQNDININNIQLVLDQLNENSKYRNEIENIKKIKNGTFSERTDFLKEYNSRFNLLKSNYNKLKNNIIDIKPVIKEINIQIENKFYAITSASGLGPFRYVLNDSIFQINNIELIKLLKELEDIDNQSLYHSLELFKNANELFNIEVEIFKKQLTIEKIDSLFPKAARFVVMEKNPTAIFLKNKLHINIGQSNQLIAQLEATGIVTFGDTKNSYRDILVSSVSEVNWLISNCIIKGEVKLLGLCWTPTTEKYTKPIPINDVNKGIANSIKIN